MHADDWITLSMLGSFTGAVFTVTVISQFLKEIVDHYVKLPTRVLVLVISWLVLLGYRYVTKGALHPEGVYLDVLNGFLVALASMGAHSVAKDRLGWR